MTTKSNFKTNYGDNKASSWARTQTNSVKILLDARLADGYWRGALSGSALATATALFALAVVNQEKYSRLIEKGLLWLAENVNSDGGWGDTIVSDSNISTTVLCWAAFTPTKDDPQYQKVVERATDWLTEQAGNTRSKNIAQALTRRYGHDRTFSAPILTMSALSGRWGSSNQAWQYVKPLPFEWGVISHRWLKWLRLPVVSYALPALIAIGQVRYHFLKPRNPLALLIRHLARNKTLSVLQKIQPDSGGFLEAIPITSFVVMSLAEMGLKDHTVVKKGVEFITASMREDGSWPIDTNLATWVTTLSVKALAGGSGLNKHLDSKERQKIVDWLLMQQHRTEHPYTQAAPGGWAWTDLSGGVPDADDTAGALLALRKLAEPHERILPAVKAGVQWLLKLQNRDGGIPTFCRGWGKLPFDRSGADLTAHAVAAWDEWFDILPKQLQKRTQKAIYKAIHYLLRVQRPEGSWIPLWFANQAAPGRENPTYGTARVVSAVVEPLIRSVPQAWLSLEKALQWLIKIKNDDGGWGGAQNVVSSIEETAVAVQALQKYYSVCNHIEGQPTGVPSTKVKEAIDAGINWLMVHTKEGTEFNPVPIGLYFAELWYYEKLYPIIFTVAALEQNARLKSW